MNIAPVFPASARPAELARPSRWSIVIPYYNEADGFLEPTLRSLLAQTERPLNLILVDNGSTDGSSAIAKMATASVVGVTTRHLLETIPGQIHALESELAMVETEFVAICDADTKYPLHYLEHAAKLLNSHGPEVIAVMAMGVGSDPWCRGALLKRWKGVVLSYVLKNQAHTGGYAHCFRTSDLRAVGGYSKRLWPFLLTDHELIHRFLKRGRTLHHPDQWCQPSDRRLDRTAVRWTLIERLLYHFTPFAAKDWFFYRFLAGRFARRGMSDLKLRSRGWETRPVANASVLS